MKPVQEWLKDISFLHLISFEKILASVILIIGLMFLQKMIQKMLEARASKIEKIFEWKKLSRYILGIIGIFLFLRIWFQGFDDLLTFFGIVSAGIAIALKDFVANIVGWIFIISRNPFNVGDRIQVGDISGDVVDIRLFQFTLLEIGNWVDSDQSTGRLYHIPNSRVLQIPQANYTQSFKYIWNEISCYITFESNFEKGKKKIEKILNKVAVPMIEGAEEEFHEAQKKFLIFHGTLTPKVYIKVADNGVQLISRYLVPARKRRDSEDQIWHLLLKEFQKAPDIAFAYPTTRFYNSPDSQPVKIPV